VDKDQLETDVSRLGRTDRRDGEPEGRSFRYG